MFSQLGETFMFPCEGGRPVEPGAESGHSGVCHKYPAYSQRHKPNPLETTCQWIRYLLRTVFSILHKQMSHGWTAAVLYTRMKRLHWQMLHLLYQRERRWTTDGLFNIRSGATCLLNHCQLISSTWRLCRVFKPKLISLWHCVKMSSTSHIFKIICLRTDLNNKKLDHTEVCFAFRGEEFLCTTCGLLVMSLCAFFGVEITMSQEERKKWINTQVFSNISSCLGCG